MKLKSVCLAIISAASFIHAAGTRTFYVGEVKLDFNTPKWSLFRDKVDGQYGMAFGFDISTDAGKEMYSLLLTAVQVNRKVRVSYGDTYDTWFTKVEAITLEAQ